MSRKDKKRKGVFGKVMKGVNTNAPMTPAQEAEAKRQAEQMKKDRKAIAGAVKKAEAEEQRRRDADARVKRIRAEYERFKREQEGK